MSKVLADDSGSLARPMGLLNVIFKTFGFARSKLNRFAPWSADPSQSLSRPLARSPSNEPEGSPVLP